MTTVHPSRGFRLTAALLALLALGATSLAAQARGTMQVSARVVEGRPAYEGLQTMQRVVGEAPGTEGGVQSRESLSRLSRIDVAPVAAPAPNATADRRVVATIQYLRN